MKRWIFQACLWGLNSASALPSKFRTGGWAAGSAAAAAVADVCERRWIWKVARLHGCRVSVWIALGWFLITLVLAFRAYFRRKCEEGPLKWENSAVGEGKSHKNKETAPRSLGWNKLIGRVVCVWSGSLHQREENPKRKQKDRADNNGKGNLKSFRSSARRGLRVGVAGYRPMVTIVNEIVKGKTGNGLHGSFACVKIEENITHVYFSPTWKLWEGECRNAVLAVKAARRRLKKWTS